MNLEQQVTSLELSQKLKALRVKQESVFVWYTNAGTGHLLYLGEDGMRPMEEKTFSAFTCSELGEMLPDTVDFQDSTYYFLTTWKRACGEYAVKYKVNAGKDYFPAQIGSTEADARGKCLIYLLENGLIYAKDIK